MIKSRALFITNALAVLGTLFTPGSAGATDSPVALSTCEDAALASITACLGARIDRTLAVTNCAGEPRDLVVVGTLNGIPVNHGGGYDPSATLTNLAAGESRNLAVNFTCLETGSLSLNWNVTSLAVGSLDTLSVSDTPSSVTCIGTCATLSVRDTMACHNSGSAPVRFLITNCGDQTQDMELEFFVDGFARSPVAFDDVLPGAIREHVEPVLCRSFRPVEVTATLSSRRSGPGLLCTTTVNAASQVVCFAPQVEIIAPPASICTGTVSPVPIAIRNLTANALPCQLLCQWGAAEDDLISLPPIPAGETRTVFLSLEATSEGDFPVDLIALSVGDEDPCQVLNVLEMTVNGQPCAQTGVETGRLSLATHLFPNPVRQSTRITYTIPSSLGGAALEVRIYGVDGRALRTLARGTAHPGEHTVSWDGRDELGSRVPAGVYFYRLAVGHHHLSRRFLVLD